MKTTIIGIAGGTASGKQLLLEKYTKASQNYGSVVVIKLDDYYRQISGLTYEERTKINYDHPDSYDSDLLIKHLNDLKMEFPLKNLAMIS